MAIQIPADVLARVPEPGDGAVEIQHHPVVLDGNGCERCTAGRDTGTGQHRRQPGAPLRGTPDHDGIVRGAQSRQAAEVFENDELRGADVKKLLYPDAGAWDAELKAFEQWVALAFEAGAEAWDEVAKLAPPSVRLGAGDAAGGA